jgi:putative membrane protein insertion efficiency factor
MRTASLNAEPALTSGPVVRPAQLAVRLIERYQARPRRDAGRCVFTPTCSEYARLAFSSHGVLRGGVMTTRRLLRCHGGNAGAVDYPT